MSRSPSLRLVIDARPDGPFGPLAAESILGRPVLVELVETAARLGAAPVIIHARHDDEPRLDALLSDRFEGSYRFASGPPANDCAVLRTDRVYDARKLGRALQQTRDPESAVIWRIDSPSALAGAADELIRRRTYQPLGQYWARRPALALARRLSATRVHPNHLTLAAGSLVIAASVLVGSSSTTWPIRIATAAALALALILDTADGHLARLQGTASRFGRWLDAFLDELGDMTLHAGIAWAGFALSGHPAWLVLGMIYAIGKYLFVVGNATWDEPRETSSAIAPTPATGPRNLAHWIGHADIRWHAWIVLALFGRLDIELVLFAAYFPLRAFFGLYRKAKSHA